MGFRRFVLHLAGAACLGTGAAIYVYGFERWENLAIKATSLGLGAVAAAIGIYWLLLSRADESLAATGGAPSKERITPLAFATALLFLAMGALLLLLAAFSGFVTLQRGPWYAGSTVTIVVAGFRFGMKILQRGGRVLLGREIER